MSKVIEFSKYQNRAKQNEKLTTAFTEEQEKAERLELIKATLGKIQGILAELRVEEHELLRREQK